jgi:hypothetical protein
MLIVPLSPVMFSYAHLPLRLLCLLFILLQVKSNGHSVVSVLFYLRLAVVGSPRGLYYVSSIVFHELLQMRIIATSSPLLNIIYLNITPLHPGAPQRHCA